MFYHDIAKRQRKCNTCTNPIEPGEHHARYLTNDQSSPRNVCIYCLRSVVKEIEEAEANQGISMEAHIA